MDYKDILHYIIYNPDKLSFNKKYIVRYKGKNIILSLSQKKYGYSVDVKGDFAHKFVADALNIIISDTESVYDNYKFKFKPLNYVLYDDRSVNGKFNDRNLFYNLLNDIVGNNTIKSAKQNSVNIDLIYAKEGFSGISYQLYLDRNMININNFTDIPLDISMKILKQFGDVYEDKHLDNILELYKGDVYHILYRDNGYVVSIKLNDNDIKFDKVENKLRINYDVSSDKSTYDIVNDISMLANMFSGQELKIKIDNITELMEQLSEKFIPDIYNNNIHVNLEINPKNIYDKSRIFISNVNRKVFHLSFSLGSSLDDKTLSKITENILNNINLNHFRVSMIVGKGIASDTYNLISIYNLNDKHGIVVSDKRDVYAKWLKSNYSNLIFNPKVYPYALPNLIRFTCE